MPVLRQVFWGIEFQFPGRYLCFQSVYRKIELALINKIQSVFDLS